jgi:vancomycin resistance protein VanJ
MRLPRLVGLRRGMLAVSFLLCVGAAWCYQTRPDSCAAITVFPAWVWLILGVLLGWLARDTVHGSLLAACAGLWLAFGLYFADQPLSLIRRGPYVSADWDDAHDRGLALRVITLNCAGSVKAAEEVGQYGPDIVLLQESPGRAAVEAFAGMLFGDDGSALAGPDASIVARGTIEPNKSAGEWKQCFVQARVRLTTGAEASVVSLRLEPPLVRIDLWSPACWRAQGENRRARRAQLQAIAEQFHAAPAALPLIVGGDFNAPAGDAVYDLLPPRLADAFEQAGRGWGNTIVNHAPFHRIDQVWISGPIVARSARAVKTEHSDHRMVIVDLLITEASK